MCPIPLPSRYPLPLKPSQAAVPFIMPPSLLIFIFLLTLIRAAVLKNTEWRLPVHKAFEKEGYLARSRPE